MCFRIRLLNLEFFVLNGLIRYPTNIYFWWGLTDEAFGISWHRHLKRLGGCNVAIISFFKCLLSRRYGRHSFFFTGHCSGNTYKGTKQAGRLTRAVAPARLRTHLNTPRWSFYRSPVLFQRSRKLYFHHLLTVKATHHSLTNVVNALIHWFNFSLVTLLLHNRNTNTIFTVVKKWLKE